MKPNFKHPKILFLSTLHDLFLSVYIASVFSFYENVAWTIVLTSDSIWLFICQTSCCGGYFQHTWRNRPVSKFTTFVSSTCQRWVNLSFKAIEGVFPAGRLTVWHIDLISNMRRWSFDQQLISVKDDSEIDTEDYCLIISLYLVIYFAYFQEWRGSCTDAPTQKKGTSRI